MEKGGRVRWARALIWMPILLLVTTPLFAERKVQDTLFGQPWRRTCPLMIQRINQILLTPKSNG